MAWRIYEFLDASGEGIIVEWIRKKRIQKKALAILNQKVDMLRTAGGKVPPQLLAGPIYGHIYKLKVKGRVQLRPLLSKGPVNNEEEFTFLFPCIEKDDELEPANGPERAEENRLIILEDNKRRRSHDGNFDFKKSKGIA